MKLRFNFELLPNPYDEIKSKYLLWGRIFLRINNYTIIDHQWDILEVIEWFFEKKNFLNDDCIFCDKEFNTIVELRNYLFNLIADELLDYKQVEKVEDYFSKHTFRLKGTPLGSFYIGIFKNDTGQISFKRDNSIYSFDFSMNDFIHDTDNQINKIIKRYIDSEFVTDECVSKISELKLIN